MKKNFRNFEKKIIKLGIFVNFLKMKHFLHFKTGMILFDFILQFWRSTILLCGTLYLFLHVALCNQPTVVLRHWKWYWKRTFKPYSTPLWTIAFSAVTYIDLWWSVNDLQKNALKIEGTNSTVDILTSDKTFFSFFLQFYFPCFNWQSK